MWRCPLCQHSLQKTDRTWRCENRHAFDEAKSGYLNLLPVQQKKSKHPGDDKTMLNARRCFHDARGYEPLMAKVTECIEQFYADKRALSLFDAGCGEGSYLGYVSEALTAKGYDIQASGSDIAKHAVDLAAKRFKSCQFAVASSVNLPIEDNALDIVMQIFAPGSAAEYQRVLKPGGLLIVVDPGEDHLWSIKKVIYDTPNKHDTAPKAMPGLELLRSERVSFNVDLTNTDTRLALLQMTPYYWRQPEDKVTELMDTVHQVEADFVIHLWQCAKS